MTREVARYCGRRQRPLLVKDILHLADAENAVSLSVDGLVVANHGSWQIEVGRRHPPRRRAEVLNPTP